METENEIKEAGYKSIFYELRDNGLPDKEKTI
jgi:hypothetical protein